MRTMFTFLAMLFLIPYPNSGGQSGWKQFTSPTGFSVMYPGTWRRIGTSEDRLYIVSSKGGAQGVVIHRGQGEIIVREFGEPVTATLSELIELDAKGDSVLSRREIHDSSGQGCTDLTEVIFKGETGPASYEIDTGFYCELRGRKFSTLLRNWEGDKRQMDYQQIALRVARSLRLTK